MPISSPQSPVVMEATSQYQYACQSHGFLRSARRLLSYLGKVRLCQYETHPRLDRHVDTELFMCSRYLLDSSSFLL